MSIGSDTSFIITVYEVQKQVIVLPDGTVERIKVLVSFPEAVTLSAAPAVFSGNMEAKLGDGDDALDLGLISKVAFLASATIDGQGGNNTAFVHNANLPRKPTLVHFQVVNQ